ncbi:MAG: GxxExxY protein [Candidatus Levybacteria bacterium]|nr:GxxExxY protein [Candidatus Levybacteria bacterium]
MKNQQSDKILHKELSYEIVGALFDAFKNLGSNYQEKYCQKAVEIFLTKRKIPFKREVLVQITIDNNSIGKHYLDFLINESVILELKKGNKNNMSDIKQVLMYLKTTGLKLGILAYFGSNGVTYKRIINNSRSSQTNS